MPSVQRTLILMESFNFEGKESHVSSTTPSVTRCMGRIPYLGKMISCDPLASGDFLCLETEPVIKETHCAASSCLAFNLISPNISLDIILPKLKTHQTSGFFSVYLFRTSFSLCIKNKSRDIWLQLQHVKCLSFQPLKQENCNILKISDFCWTHQRTVVARKTPIPKS